MSRPRILIVEDELIVREDLRDLLEGLDYKVVGAAVAGREAIAKAQDLRPDLVLMDIKLQDDMDGVDAARAIRTQFELPVVFLTAFVDERTIKRAAEACPYGYLTKPFNVRAIRATIEVALHRHREERPALLRPAEGVASAKASINSFHGLVGRSAAMRNLFEEISRLAQVNSTVLITGETGTGKERVARALHEASPRGSKPFITVNCAALTETLAASELFGHRRGAFTGALHDHKGIFEAAEGGTILLDEISDVPKAQQPFLLRVLEEREVTRVGETSPRKVDVRVLTASNRSLDEEVAAGRFRSDLLYRIRVARILVPSLRERVDDIPLLARHFLAQFREDGVLAEEAAAALCAHDWPGNVRELKNAMEFAAIRGLTGNVQLSDLPPEILAANPEAGLVSLPLEEQRNRLLAAIEKACGNRTEAARLLGISRATFYRRLSENGLPASDPDLSP